MTNTNLLPLPDNETLEKEFKKIKPLMTASEAVVESSRCLFCHDAPCIKACPTSIDIPMFIRQIMTKNIKGSAKTIFTQNILGKSCGEVCPTQVLCEGSCVYLELNEKPIDIGRLQAYATGYAIENDIHFFKAGKATGKKIAVIGGGPAGLACAHELTVLGHKVTVLEANKKAGGLNTYGVAPYKLTNKDSLNEVEYISKIGFEIKAGIKVSSNNIEELEKNHDAIFISTGLGESKKIKIPGEGLKGVIGATEFIHNLRDKEQKIVVGKNIFVIGAGNTAIDAAVESSKLGANVTVIYRRSAGDQNAYDFEVNHAKENNVNFLYLTSPIEISGKEHVEKIKCIKNKLIKSKSNIKSSIEPIKGSEFELDCDMVILATGQERMIDLFSGIKGLETDNGKIIVNKNFQTTSPKYFAGGDCVNGGKEVVNAVAHGRDAARGIDKYLMSNNTCHSHENGNPEKLVSNAGFPLTRE